MICSTGNSRRAGLPGDRSLPCRHWGLDAHDKVAGSISQRYQPTVALEEEMRRSLKWIWQNQNGLG
jgi:hypothetical protein